MEATNKFKKVFYKKLIYNLYINFTLMTGKYEFMFNPDVQIQFIGFYKFLREKCNKLQKQISKK